MLTEIMIVDDDKDTRDVLSVALSAEGYSVRVADSLIAALALLKDSQSSTACMLLDYNLPGMPLDDFMGDVRALSPLTAVILISAINSAGEKAEKYGIKHFIPKPIDFDDLRLVMKKAMGED